MSERRQSILDILTADSRTDVKDIAIMLGCTEEEAQAEIKAMEAEGAIAGYTTIVNSDKAYGASYVQALIEVRITPQRDRGFDAVAERIYKFDDVQAVYLMSGAYDLMVLMQGTSMREIAQFVAERLSTVDGVLSTATHFVLKKYKDQGVMLDAPCSDSRLLVTP